DQETADVVGIVDEGDRTEDDPWALEDEANGYGVDPRELEEVLKRIGAGATLEDLVPKNQDGDTLDPETEPPGESLDGTFSVARPILEADRPEDWYDDEAAEQKLNEEQSFNPSGEWEVAWTANDDSDEQLWMEDAQREEEVASAVLDLADARQSEFAADDASETSGELRDGDDSIDSYMARLMQRLGRGEFTATGSDFERNEPASRSSVSAFEAKTSNETAPRDELPGGGADGPARSEEDDERPVDLVPPRKRSRPAEASVDLAAIRDVANQSARIAITRYSVRRQAQLAMMRTFIAIVSTMIGGTLASWANSWTSLTALLAIASFLVAVACLGSGVHHFMNARRGSALSDG